MIPGPSDKPWDRLISFSGVINKLPVYLPELLTLFSKDVFKGDLVVFIKETKHGTVKTTLKAKGAKELHTLGERWQNKWHPLREKIQIWNTPWGKEDKVDTHRVKETKALGREETKSEMELLAISLIEAIMYVCDVIAKRNIIKRIQTAAKVEGTIQQIYTTTSLKNV